MHGKIKQLFMISCALVLLFLTATHFTFFFDVKRMATGFIVPLWTKTVETPLESRLFLSKMNETPIGFRLFFSKMSETPPVLSYFFQKQTRRPRFSIVFHKNE